MDAHEFLELEHRSLAAKAERVDAARGDARMHALASFVIDSELHAQLAEEMLTFVRSQRGVRTIPSTLVAHGESEQRLLAELAGMDEEPRRLSATIMALRKRALYGAFAPPQDSEA